MQKKIAAAVLAAIFFVFGAVTVNAENSTSLDLNAKSVILMEAQTGKVLYELNPDEALPPASVTKIMTLLLVMEAVDSGQINMTDMVTISETAANMGGSQVYLEPGEQFSVEELIKCVTVASANDAAVALAEFVAGSEESFVDRMNKRASELGMKNSNFENTNGLDDSTVNHVTSARDIAIMSRELLKHDKILKFTTIWMDSIRNGTFGLTNTNKLVRFYPGANGLKTGSTSKAGFCISATAKRDGMQLIAVVMASPNRDMRNEAAKKLLDYGFANYSLAHYEQADMEPIVIKGGVADKCPIYSEIFSALVGKGQNDDIVSEVDLPEYIQAPVEKGSVAGTITYKLNGETIGTSNIICGESVDRISYFGLLKRLIQNYLIV